MDDTEIKHVVEAALLAAGRPLTVDRLLEIFTKKGSGPDRAAIKRALEALAADYELRGIEIKEVASGYRVQVKRAMSDWLAPLWEERAPRYTRALLETLALVAYRQPITRAEIEEVRGVVVSTNIVRTLLERSWIRVVGHRDVPGKPAMFGTTREFLDYFGLKRLEDLPPLAELKDGFPELSPQADLIESLDTGPHLTVVGDEDTEAAVEHDPAQHAPPADSSAASEHAPVTDESSAPEHTPVTDDSSAPEHTPAADDSSAPEHAPATEETADDSPVDDSDRRSTGALEEDTEHDGEREALRAKASD
jgi:segregation and condensation protein B